MNRPHRAWLVCLGGALTLLSTIGLGVNVFAVYQPEILALEHFTNAQGSLITTVRSLFILVALLTVNRVCARLGLRRTMTLGVLLIALSCFCFGAAGPFGNTAQPPPSPAWAIATGGWSPCHCSLAGGSAPAGIWPWGWPRRGSGVASIVASPLVVRVIEGRGLQAAFWLEGAALVVLAGVVWLLVRSDRLSWGWSPWAEPPPTPTPLCPSAAPAPRPISRPWPQAFSSAAWAGRAIPT